MKRSRLIAKLMDIGLEDADPEVTVYDNDYVGEGEPAIYCVPGGRPHCETRIIIGFYLPYERSVSYD